MSDADVRSDETVCIVLAVSGAEQAAVLRLLVGQPDEAPDEVDRRVAELNEAHAAGLFDLSRLLAARRGGRIVGAALWTVTADGAGTVWPSKVERFEDRDLALRLLREAARSADEIVCPFVQCLIDPQQMHERRLLADAGFLTVAELLILQRPLDRTVVPQAVPPGQVLCWTEEAAERFHSLIERTYAGSRDCPAFASRRSAAESTASYRSSGVFTPQRWQLLEAEGRDEAVLLVNDRPQDRGREIVYLGVVPEARGRRLGETLTAAAPAEAAADGCDAVSVVVDAANEPALRVYRRLGFVPVGRRAVHVRFAGGGTST